MTITYPRDLPTPYPWRACRFDLAYMQVRTPTRGGLVQVANVGRDYWTIRYETVALREPQAAAFEAWLASLRGGARLFNAYHPLREYPINYPTGFSGLNIAGGGGPFPGYGLLDSVGGTLDTIQISALPASFALKAGDMLSFGYSSTKKALHRILEDATASAGGVVTVTVEPTVALGYSAGGQVSFASPSCLAVLDASSVQIAWQASRKASFSFSADQVH